MCGCKSNSITPPLYSNMFAAQTRNGLEPVGSNNFAPQGDLQNYNDPLNMDSILGIKPSLGVSERLLADKGGQHSPGGADDFNMWASDAEVNRRTDATAWVVPQGLKDLAALLPTTLHADMGIEFAYTVEPVGQQPDRAHHRTVRCAYAPPPKEGGCTIAYASGSQGASRIATGASVERAGLDLAAASNSMNRTGLGSNMHVAQEEGREPDCLGVLTIMWLIQLDVVGGQAITVAPSINAMRQGVPFGTSMHEEAESVKNLEGIRLHVDALDPLTIALLYAAANRSSVTGLSDWVDRYDWPKVPITLYGGPASSSITTTRRQGRRDAEQLAASILEFTHRYGLQQQCAKAYGLAAMLYGDRCVNSSVRLLAGDQSLFHDLHALRSSNHMPQMCLGFANPQLVLSSCYMGYANSEYLRDLSHGIVNSVLKVRDVRQTRRLLTDVDEHTMNKISEQYAAGQCVLGDLPVDIAHYARHGLRRAWSVRGILHNLSLGRVVSGSISDSAVQVIRMPEREKLLRTDIIADAHDRTQTEQSTWLLDNLVRNGGMNLSSSISEAVPRSGTTAQLHHSMGFYMGQCMQLKVIGFGNSIEIHYYRADNLLFNPTPTMSSASQAENFRVPEVRTGKTDDEELITEQANKEVISADDLLKGVMASRGTRTSTVFLRPRTRPKVEVKEPIPEVRGTTDIKVEAIHPQAIAAVKQLEEQQAGPQPTSGLGLLCGARAFHQALIFNGDDRYATADAANELILNSMSMEQRNWVNDVLSQEAEGKLTAGNYTADQLAAGATAAGYDLVVVTGQGQGSAKAYTVTDGNQPNGRLILFNMSGNHWEGPGHVDSQRWVLAGPDEGKPAITAHRPVKRI